MIFVKLFITPLVFGCALSLAAQDGKPAQPSTRPPVRAGGRGNTREFLGLGPAPDAAAAARGEKLYGPNCGFCHGAKANGAEGPDLVRSPLVLHDEKGELIGPVIHNGRPDKGMPPFAGLTEAELADIGQFLHMRVELAVNRGLYQVQNIVTGNPKAGEVYFNGAGKCATCHSVTGNLAHVGSKFQPSELQQAFLYPSARGFQPGGASVTKVTVTLPSGKAVSGALKRLDDFNVSLYDAAGEYYSFDRASGVKVEVEDKLAGHRDLLPHYTDVDMHNLTAYLATIK